MCLANNQRNLHVGWQSSPCQTLMDEVDDGLSDQPGLTMTSLVFSSQSGAVW